MEGLIMEKISNVTSPPQNPHLPYRNLYPTLVEYIECVAKMTQSPIDFVVTGVLALSSGAIGSRLILVVPKGYRNPPVLWVCLVALSGIGKSPVLGVVSKPFDDMQKELEKSYRKDKREWANTGGNFGDKPIKHYIYMTRTTLEGVESVLANEPLGCTLYRDELSAWFRDMGRYNGGASGDVQAWLNIFDRKTIITVLATKDSEIAFDPTLAIIGGTQPEELPRILQQNLFDDGLVARFLWCFPDCQKPLKYLTCPIPEKLSSFWHGLLKKLNTIQPTTITMTKEAQNLFIDYWESLAFINASCTNPEIQKFIPKLQIYVEKWAILSEVLSSEYCDSNEMQIKIDSVGEDAMRMAIEAMECFRAWGEKVVRTVYTKYDFTRIGKRDAIRSILRLYPGTSQASLAKVLRISPQRISQILKE